MKHLWSLYRTGLSVIVPLFLFVTFLLWFWTTLVTVSYGHASIAIGILALGPIMVGWLISKKWVRAAVLRFCEDIPLVSTVANFLLNHDYVEHIKSGDLMREVIFEMSEGVWVFGVVVSRHRMPLYPQRPESPTVDWLGVLVPTTPVLFTGHIILVPEMRAIYTGRLGTDTAMTAASFGFNMRIDEKKFVRNKFK